MPVLDRLKAMGLNEIDSTRIPPKDADYQIVRSTADPSKTIRVRRRKEPLGGYPATNCGACDSTGETGTMAMCGTTASCSSTGSTS